MSLFHALCSLYNVSSFLHWKIWAVSVWLIPFLYTLSGLELQLCWFIKDAQVLPVLVLNRYSSFSIYICQWPHIPFVDGQEIFLPSHSAPILPPPWLLGLQFNFACQRWHRLCRLPRRCSLSFFDSFDSSVQMIITGIVQRSPGCQPWSNTHREWVRRGSELKTSCASCQWLTDSLLL